MIWVALVALSLLYVVLLGIKLWRHFVALGREFTAASERISFSEPIAAAELVLSNADSAATGNSSREPGWAVHADPAEVRSEYAQGKQDRRAARRDRRIERRTARGQAQSLSDLRHAGRDLTR